MSGSRCWGGRGACRGKSSTPGRLMRGSHWPRHRHRLARSPRLAWLVLATGLTRPAFLGLLSGRVGAVGGQGSGVAQSGFNNTECSWSASRVPGPRCVSPAAPPHFSFHLAGASCVLFAL